MDQTRMAGNGTLETDRSRDAGMATKSDAGDLRTLDELELMLAGGGDGGPNWP